MKKKINKWIIVGILLLGIGMYLYPQAADYLSQQHASTAVTTYSETITTIDAADLAAARQDAEAYNRNLTGEDLKPPFMEDSGMVIDNEKYYSLLNFDGVMGYLTIPKIDVELTIRHGTSEAVLRKGVGHLKESALPVGGAGTHTVLTGHTGLANARLFTDLTELEVGDTFYIHTLGEVLAYQVDQIKIVEPNELEDLMPVRDNDYATLVTCTPYGINNMRLLVRGVRIEYRPDEIQQTVGQTSSDRTLQTVRIASVAVVTVIVAVVVLADSGKPRNIVKVRRKKHPRKQPPVV